MEEVEIDEDYFNMGSLDSTIRSMRQAIQAKQEKPPTSPCLTQPTQVSSTFDNDQHGKRMVPPDDHDVKTEEEKSIYQLPKANPTPSPRSQHIVGPLLPPKAGKQTKLSKPVTHQSQQSPLSPQNKDITDTVHLSPDDDNVVNKLTQSNKSDKESVPHDANNRSSSGPDEIEQQDKLSDKPLDPLNMIPPRNIPKTDKPLLHHPQSPASPLQKDKAFYDEKSFTKPDGAAKQSTYQPIMISPLPTPTLYEKRQVSLVPPRNIMRSKPNKSTLQLESPTSPEKADAVVVTTPVKETIQSPTGSDIPTELVQGTEKNDSFNAGDDKKSSSESDKTEHQESSAHQALQTNPVSSLKACDKPTDVPPRNILRTKPNSVLHHPLSPDKDKIPQDKIISTKDKTDVLLTPPRTLNPYVIDSSRKARSSSLKEKEQRDQQQHRESTSAQENNTQPSEQSFTLEEFVEAYPLPQLVNVTEGHYGDTDEFSMSEGMEIIVFFKKETQAVTATARHTDKTYYIPMNCSLQFSPYQRDSREHLTKSYFYKTVGQLLHRIDGIPKVVKVLKGRRIAPALNANELLFPKGLSSKGTHLKFTDIKKEEIRLKLSCDIGFSTNPSDTKMPLADYVENIDVFPSSVMVFCDPETTGTMFEIHTGMEMVLQESKMFYSCICSTDVHGTSKYPLIEIPTALPIEIKAIKSPSVALEPIYDMAKKVYETFDLSMIQTSMFLAQDDKHDYTEIRKSDNYLKFTRSSNFYNLEMPAIVYTMGRAKNPKSNGSSITVASPPLPPRHSGPTSCKLQTQSQFFHHKKQLPQDPIQDGAYVYTSMADERRFYLKSFTTAHVLKLLDKMNLSQFKGVFQKNDIDGKLLLLLTKYELEEMGVKDSAYQKQLLDVISGHTAYKVK